MTLRQALAVVELRTKIVSLSGLLIGFVLATRAVGFERLDVVALALFATAEISFDLATTAFNSFFDYARKVDRRSTNHEADKVLVHEGVAPGAALLIAVALFAIGTIVGIVLAGRVGGWIILPGVAAAIVALAYSGGPHPISATPLGEIASGGVLGWLLVWLTARVAAGAPIPGAALGALPSGLMVAQILAVNNACDRENDRAAGRRTIAVLGGPHVAAALVYALGAGAFVAAAFGAAGAEARTRSPLWIAPLVAGAAWALRAWARPRRDRFQPTSKGASMRLVVRTLVIFTGSYVAALLLR